jgi:hypothetical protein
VREKGKKARALRVLKFERRTTDGNRIANCGISEGEIGRMTMINMFSEPGRTSGERRVVAAARARGCRVRDGEAAAARAATPRDQDGDVEEVRRRQAITWARARSRRVACCAYKG